MGVSVQGTGDEGQKRPDDQVRKDYDDLVLAMVRSVPADVRKIWNALGEVRRQEVLRYRDGLGENLLSCAVEGGSDENVRLFVEAGAELDAIAGHGATPLYTAASKRWNSSVVRILVEAGANKDFVYPSRLQSVLMVALESGSKEAALYLLEKGAAASPEDRSDSGYGLLELAIKSDNCPVFEQFVSRGFVDSTLIPPLELAVSYSASSIVAFCLSDPSLSAPAQDEGFDYLLRTCTSEDVRPHLLAYAAQRSIEHAVEVGESLAGDGVRSRSPGPVL